MTTLNISINEELLAYIESRVTMGDYQNVSDYLRDLVAQDRERTEKTDQLLMEGLESGNAIPLNMSKLREQALSMLENEQRR
jgi:antitoxin ParD1/3/4